MLAAIEEVITPAIEACGLQLYGCEFHGAATGRPVLLVYVDSQSGVSIDDCALVSRQLGAVLNVQSCIQGSYELQVSSPGIDRPLFSRVHYEQALGKKVKLKLRQPYQKQRNFVGILDAVTEQQLILLQEDGEKLIIDFADIDKAKLMASH